MKIKFSDTFPIAHFPPRFTLAFILALPSSVQAQFTYTIDNNQITITGDTNVPANGVVVIPSVIDGLPVKSIGRAAFADYTSFTSVTIPDSVTAVGFSAFDGCTSLTSITIGNSVTNIVSFPFYNCPNLTEIYFRGNAPTFRYGVFPPGDATVYYLPGAGWPTTFGFLPTALWLPQMQNISATFGAQTNQFGFIINWTIGQTVMVETCTNLFNPVWRPVQTNTLAGDSVYFCDPQWTNYPCRFYRINSQ